MFFNRPIAGMMIRASSPPLFPKPSLLQRIPQRTKVLLPSSHPFEYFRNNYDPAKARFAVHHPTPVSSNTPLYYKITLNRSLIGLPWQKRYIAGVLFKYYAPHKSVRPKAVKPRISTQTTIYREATPETAEMILQLKEILKVENIWSAEEYRQSARPLLGKYGKTVEELQQHRGYYIEGSLLMSGQPQQQPECAIKIVAE